MFKKLVILFVVANFVLAVSGGAIPALAQDSSNCNPTYHESDGSWTFPGCTRAEVEEWLGEEIATNDATVEDEENSIAPTLFDADSCAPEMGWCSFDIGTKEGQITLVFGVDLKWGTGLRAQPSNRCEVVVLTEETWFENFGLRDARYEVYQTAEGSWYAGWLQTLVSQRLAEQAGNYTCPNDVGHVKVWDADTEEFISLEDSTLWPNDDATTTIVEGEWTPTGEDGTLSFEAGWSVIGWEIAIGDTTYSDCYFASAPAAGTVTSGVIWPYEDEISAAVPCE